MNTKAFMDMLITSIPSDNIDQLLQAISDAVHISIHGQLSRWPQL